METFIEAWNLICDYLKNQIPEVSYNLWIGKIEPVNLDFSSGSVVLKVPTPFHRDIIMKSYQNNLKEAFNNVLGSEFQIDILTEDQMELQEETKEETKKSDDYEFTFETFIVGPSNKFAHAAAMAVATKPAVLYNPLFIYGNSGLGKTHLLYAICNEIQKNNPNTNIVYIKGDEFTNELIEAIRRGTTAEFRQKYRKSDVLLVDDIQFIAGKESTQEEFFHTFNSLHSAKKQIIISSDKPPKDMEILEERFRSRFEWGLIADITLPDYETRMAILHKNEEMNGYSISEDVIKYIATNIKSNIRELEGAFNKVMAGAKLEKKEVTLELAEQALKDIISPDEKKVITPEYIISVVAEHYGVTPADLSGNKRNSKIVMPRQVSMYLCREIISTPLKNIGKALGNRDHTTVMHGIEKIENELQTDDNLKNTIDILKKKINPQG